MKRKNPIVRGKYVPCEVCNKQIWRSGWDFRRTNKFLCSRECFYKWKVTGKNLSCKNCEKKIWIYQYDLKVRNSFFCSVKCRSLFHKNGTVGNHGYNRISVHGHDVLAHRVIMEKHLGRKLEKSEHIHHINHNRLDNRIENLILLTASQHAKLHQEERRISKVNH